MSRDGRAEGRNFGAYAGLSHRIYRGGKRTILHIIGRTGLTESEITQAVSPAVSSEESGNTANPARQKWFSCIMFQRMARI